MSQALEKAILRLLGEYDDFARNLPADSFASKMPGRSNAIGEQLWCIIGGRESAVRAVENQKWMGFDCSLTETTNKSKVVESLRHSGDLVRGAFAEPEWTSSTERIAVFVLEHEAMHQGQLIRFGYSLDLSFPQSWVEHWILTD